MVGKIPIFVNGKKLIFIETAFLDVLTLNVHTSVILIVAYLSIGRSLSLLLNNRTAKFRNDISIFVVSAAH